MKRTILNVAYPLAPVGPGAVGGAEQVLTHLDAALVRAGHRSLVVACEGSETAGTLLATPAARGTLGEEVHRRAQARHREAIDRALTRWPVDVVHLHGIDFYAYVPPPGVPVLATLHLPPNWYPPEVFHLKCPHTHLHCVSASQRHACPPDADLLPDIENGVPVDGLPAERTARRFVMALGRICPEKGFHHALDAASRAHVPCLLAGAVYPYPAHERYFQTEIAPRLDGRHRFIGTVAGERKRRLLAAARALLVPSRASETSSLVAMEAFACGTPVVAFPVGALSDIVEPGRTGFLVDDVEEMAGAIEAAEYLDAEDCRRVARERFSVERMTAQYLNVYERLARGRLHRGGGETESGGSGERGVDLLRIGP